ncbi:MAG: hypothetical protein V3U26_06105 [Dehalococcoidia bacterium]
MRPIRWPFLVGVGLALALLALAACDGSVAPTPDADATALLLEAEKNTFALDSVSFEIEMDMTIEADVMSMSMDMDVEGIASGDFETVIFESGGFDMEIDISGLGKESIEARIVNNRLQMRLPNGAWEDAGSMDDLGEDLFSDPLEAVTFEELVAKKIITVRSLGTQTIDGTPAQHLRLVYDLQRTKELLSGEILSLMGEVLPAGEVPFDKIDRYRSDVWVSLDDHVIIRQDADFSIVYSVEGMEFDATFSMSVRVTP